MCVRAETILCYSSYLTFYKVCKTRLCANQTRCLTHCSLMPPGVLVHHSNNGPLSFSVHFLNTGPSLFFIAFVIFPGPCVPPRHSVPGAHTVTYSPVSMACTVRLLPRSGDTGAYPLGPPWDFRAATKNLPLPCIINKASLTRKRLISGLLICDKASGRRSCLAG